MEAKVLSRWPVVFFMMVSPVVESQIRTCVFAYYSAISLSAIAYDRVVLNVNLWIYYRCTQPRFADFNTCGIYLTSHKSFFFKFWKSTSCIDLYKKKATCTKHVILTSVVSCKKCFRARTWMNITTKQNYEIKPTCPWAGWS